LIYSESAFVAAAIVGAIHMSAPDHWATLAVLGKGAGWARSKLVGFSIVTAAGHVSFSVTLGVCVIGLASLFSNFVSHSMTVAIGFIMLFSGLYVAVSAFRVGEEDRSNGVYRRFGFDVKLTKSASYFAVLGAALSPDLTILPVFLVAIPFGFVAVLHTVVIFAVSSILTVVLLVIVFSTVFNRAVEKIPSKYNDALVGVVIATVGAYVVLLG
jgi:hypothetical protein